MVNMETQRVPLVILGGSDRRPGRLPESGSDKHPLACYKGAFLRYRGEPLAAVLVQRAAATGIFDPVVIAGPRRIYDGIASDAEILDTDGTFGENIQASLEAVRARQPGRPVAFLACDVLPGAETLRDLMQRHARDWPCDFWFPLVRVPHEPDSLGSSRWKPTYRLVEQPGQDPTGILPGHLIVVDPEALKLRFMYRLFQQTYRLRNMPIVPRRRALLLTLLAVILREDLESLLALRVPDVIWSVLASALPASGKLRRGELSVRGLEVTLRHLFVRYEHRRRYPDRRVMIPLIDELAMAVDIDTEEEARDHELEVADAQPQP